MKAYLKSIRQGASILILIPLAFIAGYFYSNYMAEYKQAQLEYSLAKVFSDFKSDLRIYTRVPHIANLFNDMYSVIAPLPEEVKESIDKELKRGLTEYSKIINIAADDFEEAYKKANSKYEENGNSHLEIYVLSVLTFLSAVIYLAWAYITFQRRKSQTYSDIVDKYFEISKRSEMASAITILGQNLKEAKLRSIDKARVAKGVENGEGLSSGGDDRNGSVSDDGNISSGDDDNNAHGDDDDHKSKLIAELKEQLGVFLKKPEFRLIERLEDELTEQRSRGTVNLLIGIGMSIVGFFALAYTVFTTGKNGIVGTEVYLVFVAKISLSFLLQVFSYFFLGLYKSSQFETKYYQNEITNIETKFAAADRAQDHDNKSPYEHILQVLANTERNFKLSKDESTVQLQQQSQSDQHILNLLDQNSKAISSISEAIKQDKGISP